MRTPAPFIYKLVTKVSYYQTCFLCCSVRS
uniref:Uncharacterized protein n=1 Tax=Siphoviridae sp. ctTC45 TaxID=2827573 RepID=A0A8S5LQX8_9CAUD|nr:MAG TPA: hypothetical protein [Siphoviridae sp. ctTC45]